MADDDRRPTNRVVDGSKSLIFKENLLGITSVFQWQYWPFTEAHKVLLCSRVEMAILNRKLLGFNKQ
jgi:hypothetical protein